MTARQPATAMQPKIAREAQALFPTLFCRLAALFFIAASALTAAAQPPAPGTTEWESEPLSLRLFYPSDLAKSDATEIIQHGQFNLFGISGAADPTLAEATRCLRPMLLLELPHTGPAQTTTSQPTPDGGTKVTITPQTTATILLAELDVNCLPDEQMHSTALLDHMAELVNNVAGMKPIAPPSTYTIGWQKVHMAAAQGQPQQKSQQDASAKPSGPLQLFTMGISTNWNSHLLVWYFSSNSIDMLNRITKTTVRFGRAQAAPLYPVPIGIAAP
ncbi:MAG: hypothetical protein M3Y50_14795 [Acidobacteriota bacterium]|nr:hypothetical protein [Acidobacteriota bacterium]